MARISVMDIECQNLNAKGAARFEKEMTVSSKLHAKSVSASLGLLQRATTIGQGKCDAAAVGTQAEVFITLPKKSKITKFGIISAASDIVCSTTTSFELRRAAGTKIVSFVPGSAVIGSGEATGVAPAAATFIAANTPMRFCVGTDPADSGSVFYFVDFRPVDV
jgi:hypothetical protein